jgi:hypothetical protein
MAYEACLEWVQVEIQTRSSTISSMRPTASQLDCTSSALTSGEGCQDSCSGGAQDKPVTQVCRSKFAMQILYNFTQHICTLTMSSGHQGVNKIQC